MDKACLDLSGLCSELGMVATGGHLMATTNKEQKSVGALCVWKLPWAQQMKGENSVEAAWHLEKRDEHKC